MQAIRSPQSARIGALEMYRYDLEQLIALFHEHCETVKISDDKYQYDTLDEIKEQLGSYIRDFEIHGTGPSLHLRLNRIEVVDSTPSTRTTTWFNELRSDEATDEADNLFFRAREFLTKRQRSKVHWFPFSLAILAFCAAFARLTVIYQEFKQTSLYGLIGILAGSALLIASLKSSNRICLETRANALPFWRKYKEDFLKQLVNSLITALMGAIVGAIIGYFIGQMRK